MATKWKDLKHKASPETRERVKREALAEYAEMERIGGRRHPPCTAADPGCCRRADARSSKRRLPARKPE